MELFRFKPTIAKFLLMATILLSAVASDLTASARSAFVPVRPIPQFRSPQGKFAITFPQKPQLRQEQDNNGLTTFNFVTKERDSSYLVSYFDQPNLKNASRSALQSILLKVANGFTLGADMKLVDVKRITLGRHPGREFDFTKTGVVGKGRTYVVGGRVYLVVGIGNGRSINSFLNSFRLL